MNEILSKVQTDLGKLQKTLEHEGEVLLDKIKDVANKAATNKNVVAKRKEIEKLVETQIKRFEPAFDKFYKELKTTASKYGVNLETIEKKVRTTTAKASDRFSEGKAKSKKKPSAKTTTKSAVGGTKKSTTKKKSSKKV